ncbi:hypothetical protein [Arthrobacter sp. lap29]|uniref:hypothetical protein n=1 Tax=Arthrobacter sp. lap29 TaxID=3056122 RepID=UPI0028F72376|nr:hypothetical protein [Arthrobacter sp. lap29]
MRDSPRTLDTSRRSLRERWRMSIYLARFEWHLEGFLRIKERKTAISSLRKELLADPRDISVTVRALGPPAALAARWAKEGTLRPLWSIGIIAVGVVLFVYCGLLLSFAAGLLAAVKNSGIAEAHARYLFVDVSASSNADGIGIGWTSQGALLIVPAVIIIGTFIVGARLWRIGSSMPHKRTSA